MFKNNKARQCLICFKDINLSPSLFNLYYHPNLCLDCLSKFTIYNQTHLFHNYPLTILYYYDEFFAKTLFQYKAQGDIALKDAFLNAYPDLKNQYRRYTFAIVPSNRQDDKRRGFNPNEMIVATFSNNIFTGLYKNESYKQTSQHDRSKVRNVIEIKDGYKLYNQDVIIFDDVITSGNTIITCANLIALYHPRSIRLIVLASNQTDHLFK